MKTNEEKQKTKKKVTRNIFQLPYLRKSDQACCIFLVTFWNHPARSKDRVKEERKTKNKKSDEKFKTVPCQFPQRLMKKEKEKEKRRKRKL